MYRYLLPVLALFPLLTACEEGASDDSECFDEFLPDADGDGFPGEGELVVACEAPEGYRSVQLDWDCDDTDAAVYPDAPEHCDGRDENCNNEADEWPVDGFAYYADYDQDGYGHPEPTVRSCEPWDDATLVENGDDCDDFDAAVSPDGFETCDGVDEDCDGEVDNGFPRTTFYTDYDEDGFGTGAGIEACVAPYLHAPESGDCNDDESAIHPTAPERCNGLDDDCDGSSGDELEDLDGDGLTACEGDCDDTDAGAHPGGTEVCDAVDNDCNGVVNDPVVDAYEPNDTRDQAPTVAEDNETVTLTATISGPGDSDWYRIDTIDDPDNIVAGDDYFTTVTVTNLPPGVQATLHLYRRRDISANPIRRIRTDDTWEDGELSVTHDDGFWGSNDGNEHWAHLEVHSGYDCDGASYTITLSNGG